MSIHFYFDYLSPYVYLGWHRLKELQKRRSVDVFLQPVLFPAILNTLGQLGPAEIPAKRIFVFKDACRRAHDLGLPFGMPNTHPFNPLFALRITQAAPPEQRHLILDTLLTAGWGGRGAELGDPHTVIGLLNQAGLPGDQWGEAAMQTPAKEALRQATEDAIAKGVFGIPTFAVGNEIIWGQDRIIDVERCLDHNDLDLSELVENLHGYPASSQRKIR